LKGGDRHAGVPWPPEDEAPGRPGGRGWSGRGAGHPVAGQRASNRGAALRCQAMSTTDNERPHQRRHHTHQQQRRLRPFGSGAGRPALPRRHRPSPPRDLAAAARRRARAV